jgi:CRP-like cAMP-binding protein
MDPGPLVVLIDGEPTDAALVGKAREYADEKGYSVMLLRVLREVTRAIRTDTGAAILPWQVMQAREGDAKYELEKLRRRFLRGRAHPNAMLVNFGSVVEEVLSVVQTEHAQAVLARSKNSFVPWLNRDLRLQRKLAVPVLLLDAADKFIGEPAQETAEDADSVGIPLSSRDKVRAIGDLPVFVGMSRKELESVARNLDEARVDAGTTVIHEGRSNHALWIVVEGELDLSLRGKHVERISPPGLVGAPSMLDGRPAWATVTAVTPVRALVASTEQFRVLCADDRVATRLWAQTGARLRNYMLAAG